MGEITIDGVVTKPLSELYADLLYLRLDGKNQMAGNIVPKLSDTYNLGDVTHYFNTLRVGTPYMLYAQHVRTGGGIYNDTIANWLMWWATPHPHIRFRQDVFFENDTQGTILIDRTTAALYRLYVDDGVLGIEAV